MIEALRRRFLMIAMLSLTGTLCVIGKSVPDNKAGGYGDRTSLSE